MPKAHLTTYPGVVHVVSFPLQAEASSSLFWGLRRTSCARWKSCDAEGEWLSEQLPDLSVRPHQSGFGIQWWVYIYMILSSGCCKTTIRCTCSPWGYTSVAACTFILCHVHFKLGYRASYFGGSKILPCVPVGGVGLDSHDERSSAVQNARTYGTR